MRLLSLVALAACGDNISVSPDAGPLPPDAAGCVAPPPRPTDPDPTVDTLLVDLEKRMTEDGIPGLAFASIDHGTVKTYALGVRQPGGCEPFTSKTRIRLGRPTRTIVEVATLVAEAEGVLARTDLVTKYLPVHTAGGTPVAVTIEQLLDHSAGLYVGGLGQCPSQDLVGYWSTVDVALETPPGAAVASFDEELSLLGAILAKAYDKPYRTVIAEKVFAPLGMTATYDHDEFLRGEHALGGPNLVDPAPCALLEPVFQVYASLDDFVALAQLVDFFGTPALPISVAEVRDAGKRHHEVEFSTGYGMESLPYGGPGNRLYVTDGDIDEAGGELDVFADGVDFAFLMNRGACTFCIADTIIPALSSHAPTDFAMPLPKSRWGEYAGTWHEDITQPPRDVTVAFDGTKLTATFNGVTLPLTTFGEDTFEIDVFGEFDRFRFWRDASGKPQLMTSQFGKLGPAFHRVTP